MNACSQPTTFDHYLVARVQACVTGANAHDLHALLGNYHVLCLLARDDETLRVRVLDVEQKLRAFCQSGEWARMNTARQEPSSETRPIAGNR